MFRTLWHHIYNNKHLIKRYAAVGALSAMIDFGFLFILTDWLNMHYLLSATISFIFAAGFNYYLNKTWTFCSDGQKRKQLPIFATLAILGLIINNNIMYVGVEKLALHYLLAKIIAAAITTSWNFFGNKYLTFRKKKIL